MHLSPTPEHKFRTCRWIYGLPSLARSSPPKLQVRSSTFEFNWVPSWCHLHSYHPPDSAIVRSTSRSKSYTKTILSTTDQRPRIETSPPEAHNHATKITHRRPKMQNALLFVLIAVACVAISLYYARVLSTSRAKCTGRDPANPKQCIQWHIPDGYNWEQRRIDSVSQECHDVCEGLSSKCWPINEQPEKGSFGYGCVDVDCYPSGRVRIEEGLASWLQNRKGRAENEGLF